MVPTGHDVGGGGGGGLVRERGNPEHRYDEIVVLKVLDSEGKSKPPLAQGGEHALASNGEGEGGHQDIEWDRTTAGSEGNSNLPQNGYKLSEELGRRSDFLSGRKQRSSSREDVSSILSQDSVGKENIELRIGADDNDMMSEQQRNGLDSKVEKEKGDDHSLRNRVWALEEEKGKLHKDLAAMTLKETILREKVKDFELQMDGHRKRVERAEKTISELRQAAAHSSKQARQADLEVEELRLMCARKDGEKQDMQNRIERLQQLCTDHEKSIHGLRQGLKNGMDGNKEGRMSRLQKELQRLSGAEVNLRTELEASRVDNATLRRDINCLLERFANQQRESGSHIKRIDQELRAEIDRGQAKIAELQDENNLLFAKLRLVVRERQDSKEALRLSKAKLTVLEEENRCLQEEVTKVQATLQAKQMDILKLESQLENHVENNKKQATQAALVVLKEKAAANVASVKNAAAAAVKVKEKEARNYSPPSNDMRQNLQAAAQQLYSMNERLESLMDKLSERDIQLQEARAEIAGKDEVICGLEHSLSNLAKTVDSQSARLMRLSKQNEDLTSVTQSQIKQIEEFQVQIASAMELKNRAEQELETAKKRVEDYNKRIQSLDLNCQFLQERVDTLEGDLNLCNSQVTILLQQRDDLTSERDDLHRSLSDTTIRNADLEIRLADREESLRLHMASVEELTKDLSEARKELGSVKQDRDEMVKEAEAMCKEALRTSLEVEDLRRRVHQLDEDVLLRDGQLCILRGNME